MGGRECVVRMGMEGGWCVVVKEDGVMVMEEGMVCGGEVRMV